MSKKKLATKEDLDSMPISLYGDSEYYPETNVYTFSDLNKLAPKRF